MWNFSNITGFEWDEANSGKNFIKHNVTCVECEEAFWGDPVIVGLDEKHSRRESRFFLLGTTCKNRKLFIVFTIRANKVGVISARDMSKKERTIYEEKNEKNS